jgi:ADP-ribose pyrophosphatase YjhB (NUDIX family)
MNHIRVTARALIVANEAVLLVEFDDESGLHYNLPGGGVDPGETIIEGLTREAKEEASVNIEVGPLVFVIECEPNKNSSWAGPIHGLHLIFDCQLSGESRPQLPDHPDANQTAVKWVKLSELDANQTAVKWVKLSELESVELLPHIADRIIEYSRSQTVESIFLEEPLKPERIL